MGRRVASMVIAWCLVACAPLAAVASGAPKVLLYASINEWWLGETIERWAGSGFSGFILPSYVQWYTAAPELESHRAHFATLARRGAAFGITDNFIALSLAARTDGGDALPPWQDEKGWAAVLDSMRRIGAFAKDTGMRGIVIDTEPYGVGLWEVAHARHRPLTRRELKALAYDKGRRVVEALQSAFPELQLIVLQEGGFWWNAQANAEYELWPAFYDGLASRVPDIVLGTESTYPEAVLLPRLARDPGAFIRERAAQIRQAMIAAVERPDAFVAGASLAVGLWPLGPAYDDKSPRYDVRVFEAQMRAAREVSGRYVWVYAHGNAWSRMPPEEAATYSDNPWHYTFDRRAQAAPTTADLPDYLSVVRGAAGAATTGPTADLRGNDARRAR